jgi:hypothetical protein
LTRRPVDKQNPEIEKESEEKVDIKEKECVKAQNQGRFCAEVSREKERRSQLTAG